MPQFNDFRLHRVCLLGVWEGFDWRPDAALFRKDWSEKPNLDAYRNLVYKTWWTDETGDTNEKGEISLRVFKGTHRVVVENQEKVLNVDSSASIQVVL